MIALPSTILAGISDELSATEPADPVVNFFYQWREGQRSMEKVELQMKAIEIPEGVFGNPKVDWAACPELAEIGDRAIPGYPISWHELREMNRRHAWVNGLIGGKFHQVVDEERQRRVAAGRVRERWWIAERRRQRAWEVSSGWKGLSDEMDRLCTQDTELAERILNTAATSLAGVHRKLLIAAHYTADDTEARDDLQFNERLMLSATDDLKSFGTASS